MSLARELKQRAAEGRPLRIGLLIAATPFSTGNVQASALPVPLLAKRARSKIHDLTHFKPRRLKATGSAECFQFRRDRERLPPEKR